MPARGVCVVLNGQTEFVEKYGEVIGELCARGFRVAALDWRGQGGSRRALGDPLKVHIDDFRQYDEDLAAFLDMVVRPLSAGPPLVLAHSMGAHILLRTLHARPASFAAAVLSAPMIGIDTRGYPASVARLVCKLHILLGQEDEWVWGARRDPLGMPFSDQMVTSDEARHARTQGLIATAPALRSAGPTWGWLEAAYRSMRQMRGRGYAEAITTPLLVLGAGKDRIVDTRATAQFARRLPRGRYVEFEDSEHEILMERDAIRARFWAEFDAFVANFV